MKKVILLFLLLSSYVAVKAQKDERFDRIFGEPHPITSVNLIIKELNQSKYKQTKIDSVFFLGADSVYKAIFHKGIFVYSLKVNDTRDNKLLFFSSTIYPNHFKITAYGGMSTGRFQFKEMEIIKLNLKTKSDLLKLKLKRSTGEYRIKKINTSLLVDFNQNVLKEKVEEMKVFILVPERMKK